MLAVTDDWYRVVLPEGVGAATLIFNNNGNGSQTDGLRRTSNGCYEYDSAAWSDHCDVPLTVYFNKPDAWGENIYVYHWGEANTNWPGNLAENRGEGWFAYTFPDGVMASDLIFNDNAGNQTANLYRDGAGCYVDDNWTDYCAVPDGVDAGPFGVPVYIRGGMNGWSTTDQLEYLGGGQYGLTLAISNDSGAPIQYEFKVADQSWSVGSNFGGNGDALVWGEATPLYDGSSNNFAITVAASGFYRFEIDASDESAVPMMSVTPLGAYDVPLYVRGTLNNWSTDNEFQYQPDGSLATNIALEPGEYSFKVADANWSIGTNFAAHFTESDSIMTLGSAEALQDAGAVNLSLTVTEAGVYTFTLTQGTRVTEPMLTVTD